MAIKIKKKFDVNGYIVYADGDMMRFCDYCGKPILHGMTNDSGDCYVHEECFDDYMNKTYEKGKWKSTEDGEEDGAGGYYLFLNDNNEWDATGIYYTEWWDDYDVDWSYDKNRKDKENFYVKRKNWNDSTIDYIKVYIGTDPNGNEKFKYFYKANKRF